MRTPPLPADYLCQGLQTNLRKTLDTTIRKSVLTTFEALFMQNAKQIIAQKVMKTASKLMF